MQVNNKNNDIENIDVVLKAKNKNKLARQNRRFRRRLTIFLVLLIFILITGAYYYSPFSNISDIYVTGNHYMNDNIVIDLSGLEINKDKFLLQTDSSVEQSLMKSDYFELVNVKHQSYNTIVIDVIEKKVVFYTTDSDNYIYFGDGERIAITEDNFKLISHCPGINDIDEERFAELAKDMDTLSRESIDMISEIYSYTTTYDENMIHLLMSNGKHIFMSPDSLEILNNYSELSKVLTDSDECLFVDEISNGVYSSVCPWVEEIQDDEVAENETSNTEE